MWGYSTTWYPALDVAPFSPVTLAVALKSPFETFAGGETLKVTLVFSSSRENESGADAGSTCHPGGGCRVSVAVVAPFWLLPTVTVTFRAAAVSDNGKTAMSGSTATSNAGDTFSCDRFSPAAKSL